MSSEMSDLKLSKYKNILGWLGHYFIKLCFDVCQFAFYLYVQHNGMHKVKNNKNMCSWAPGHQNWPDQF